MTPTVTVSPEHRIDQLWEAVSLGDEQAATRAVFGALEDCTPAESVLQCVNA
ncbi:hypothetical protein [Streptomyces sp. NPDC127038]|uniref:hypothetical protein n=1 Tax=Streptomyces sp. NPDC127038 TaxID=3347114 RepID=UPI00365801B0